MLFLPVVEAYDRWSSFYDSYDNPDGFHGRRDCESIPRRRFSGLSVFEFGCGTGRNLAALHSFGAEEIAGCDLSEGMLKVARTRVPRANLYAHDMSNRIPVPDGSYDLALFCLTLEHIPDIRHPLREAMRVTKADGRICIIEIHPYYSLTGVAAHF